MSLPDNPYRDIHRAGMADARNHYAEDIGWDPPAYDPRDDPDRNSGGRR